MIVPNCQACKHYEKPVTQEPCKECVKTAREKEIVAIKFKAKECGK